MEGTVGSIDALVNVSLTVTHRRSMRMYIARLTPDPTQCIDHIKVKSVPCYPGLFMCAATIYLPDQRSRPLSIMLSGCNVRGIGIGSQNSKPASASIWFLFGVHVNGVREANQVLRVRVSAFPCTSL